MGNIVLRNVHKGCLHWVVSFVVTFSFGNAGACMYTVYTYTPINLSNAHGRCIHLPPMLCFAATRARARPPCLQSLTHRGGARPNARRGQANAPHAARVTHGDGCSCNAMRNDPTTRATYARGQPGPGALADRCGWARNARTFPRTHVHTFCEH